MKFNIKEPYRTAIIIGVSTSVILGAGYLLMPKDYRNRMNDWIKDTLRINKKKADEGKTKDNATVG